MTNGGHAWEGENQAARNTRGGPTAPGQRPSGGGARTCPRPPAQRLGSAAGGGGRPAGVGRGLPPGGRRAPQSPGPEKLGSLRPAWAAGESNTFRLNFAAPASANTHSRARGEPLRGGRAGTERSGRVLPSPSLLLARRRRLYLFIFPAPRRPRPAPPAPRPPPPRSAGPAAAAPAAARRGCGGPGWGRAGRGRGDGGRGGPEPARGGQGDGAGPPALLRGTEARGRRARSPGLNGGPRENGAATPQASPALARQDPAAGVPGRAGPTPAARRARPLGCAPDACPNPAGTLTRAPPAEPGRTRVRVC